MKLYFAPMEGVTGFIFRNAHHKWYPGMDKYFTPFLSPKQNQRLSTRETRDIVLENNLGIPLVPQILTNRAKEFLRTADELFAMGYREVNLNLGCPSGTVVSKGKGAGFLGVPEKLETFLDELFSKKQPNLAVSVKTRIGKDSPEEWGRLLHMFNRFPIRELIVHPRTQADLYQGHPNWKVFREALSGSQLPIGYNGDLFTVRDYDIFSQNFPEVGTVMLGRGLVADPSLAGKIRGETFDPPEDEKETLIGFHNQVYEGYQNYMSGDKNVLFKMKELWSYMIGMFPDSEKAAGRIRKAQKCSEYEAAVSSLFEEWEPNHSSIKQAVAKW